MTHKHTHHFRPLALLTLLGLLLQNPGIAVAADAPTLYFSAGCTLDEKKDLGTGFGGEMPDVEGTLQPKEEGPVSAPCEEFTVKDPTTLQTSTLRAGDTLSVAIKIRNTAKASVKNVRAWVVYDPAILSGVTLKIDPAFPQTVPGEAQFSQSEGYVKLNAGAKSLQKNDETLFALLTFVVLPTSAEKTVLSFYDAGNIDSSHTAIVTKTGDVQSSILTTTPGSLLVQLPTQAAAASSVESQASSSSETSSSDESSSSSLAEEESSSSSEASSMPVMPPETPVDPLHPATEIASSVSSAPAAGRSIFPDLQVSNLRVTTQGGTAYLGWDALPSSELAGYNIYYGATSGQYLQRKSIDRSETTLSIRGLPEGTVYYFAVRGVNPAGVETTFSNEVSVTIGKPQTSTAPLSASVVNGPNGKTPTTGGTISGESGVGSWMVVLLGSSAVIGTLLAFRKQRIAYVMPTHV